MNTVKRNWLKKQIEKGLVEAKSDMQLTDDYARDNADNFGVTGWMPARIRHPRFGKWTLPNGIEIDRCEDSDFVEGQINFNASDFTTTTGYAYRQDDGTISFAVHGNSHYTLRIKEV